MRLNSKWLAVLLVLAVIPLSGCSFMQKLRARDNLNKGVKLFTEMKYDAAAQLFQKAVDQDPEFEEAQMYLATAYTSQFVPGSADPRSEEMAQKGIETFKKVVANSKDPNSQNSMNAMLSIASLYYQLKKYEDSKEWCNRVLTANPQNADAYYRIAVINFDDVFEKTGVQGENVEYMSPEEKATALSNIDEGLASLNKAIEIRPTYFDAMEYQNLLWREKAKFESNETAKAELIRQADLVSQKALALRLKAQEEEAKLPKKLGLTK
ncbi:MAG: tetratricopeptide repeat protein [Acidobacteria bacterium]|nr:tetratricopeptide repeat protein [Acidobacteriota bacterium]